MDVTESKVFNFVFAPEGYPFNFSIMAESQAEALIILHRRLTVVMNDINTVQNQKKAGNAN